MASTPLRNFRAPDELWDAAVARSRDRWLDDRLTVTDVLVKALAAYVAGEAPYPCGEGCLMIPREGDR